MTDNKVLFAKEHDKLFADLEALNEQQIELGLAAGVWRLDSKQKERSAA